MRRNFLINSFYKTLTRITRTTQWLVGASTVGVRTLVVNEQNQVLLLKHTYMPGWHFPGGGVFSGEPARIAAIRELCEEAGVIALGDMELFGVYFHKVMWVNDYIILYIVKNFSQATVSLGGEISAVRWFSLENLPEDLSECTHQRISEYFFNHPKQDQW